MQKDTVILIWTTIISVVLLIISDVVGQKFHPYDRSALLNKVEISLDDFERLKNLKR